MRTTALSVLTVVAVGAVTAIGTSAAAAAMIPGDSAGEVQSIPAIAVASQSPAEGAALKAVVDGDGPLIASLPPVIALGGQDETGLDEPGQETEDIPGAGAPGGPSGENGAPGKPGDDGTTTHGDKDPKGDKGDKGPKDKGDKGPKDKGDKGPGPKASPGPKNHDDNETSDAS